MTGHKKPDHSKWEENIALAREIVSTKKINQMRVATLALEVCEITWGGRANRYADEMYTLKRFANEIGVNMKTLSGWVAIKTKVYEKLSNNVQSKLSFSDCRRILDVVGYKKRTSESVEKIALKYISQDRFDFKIRHYCNNLRSLASNFKKGSAEVKCSKETLQEIKFYCTIILKKIPSIKPIDHGFAKKYCGSNRHSAAKAILGGTIRSKRKTMVRTYERKSMLKEM